MSYRFADTLRAGSGWNDSSILMLPASIKVVPVHAMKAYFGSGDVASLIPNFVCRYRQAKSRQNIAVGFSFLGLSPA